VEHAEHSLRAGFPGKSARVPTHAFRARSREGVPSTGDARRQEHADYSAQHLDLSESIDAIERATATLRAKEADKAQSLLQASAPSMTRDPPRWDCPQTPSRRPPALRTV